MRHGWIVLIGSMLVVAGCGHEAIDFNNQIAAIHARLGTAVEEFGQVIHPAVQEGKPLTADELTEAVERLRGQLTAANEQSGQLRVPELPQATELYAAHQTFLAGEQRLIQEELAEIERLLAKQLTVGEVQDRLKVRLAAFKLAESRLLDTMHAAQRQFAEANRLKLTKPASDR
jgi:hypothetical protein